jgi:hypothetical protein
MKTRGLFLSQANPRGSFEVRIFKVIARLKRTKGKDSR